MEFSCRRLGASHLHGDSDSGLADEESTYPPLDYVGIELGSPASSARFFTGQKAINCL